MSEFDPYLKWLGIRESTRPINHYRLLGLELFESDPDVISMAADRQMAHIRTYQNGPHGELSQQILNELSRARRTLLVADKKSQYDQQLKASMATAPTADAPPVAIPKSSAPAIDVAIESDHSSHRKARKKREQKQAAWSLVGWVLGGVAAVAVAAVLIGTGILPLGGNGDPEILAQNDDPNAPAAAIPANTTNNSRTKDAPGSEGASPNQPDNQPRNDGDSNLAPESMPANTPDAQPRDTSPPESETAKPTLPPSSKFTLANIQQYPPRREPVKAMLNRLPRLIADQQIVASELSNPETEQVELIDRPADAKLLNGVRVWFDDQLQLCGLRAYYLSPDTISVGDLIGQQTANYVDAIADPGYAVSSVTVTGNSALSAIQLHFLPLGADGFRIGGTGYSSAWLGNDNGLKVQLFPDRHQPIVGIYGSPESQLNSIGLIRVGTVGRDLDLALTGRPAEPIGESPDVPELDTRIEIPSPTERRTLATQLETQYQLVLPNANLSARARAQMIRSLAARARSRAMNETDPDRKYVLMELAGKHYALLGDAPTVVTMLKEIDRDYQIDFWAEIKKAMEALVPLVPANQALAYKQTLDELIRQAVSEHEFEVAHELVDGAQKLSGSFQQLKRWYRQRGDLIDEFESLIEGHETAAATLQTDAADPEANEFMGDYRLLVEEDLTSALSHWAKSDSSELQRIAEAELNRDDSDGQQLVELAEKWERMGRGKADLRKIAALERALEIYEQARVMVEEDDQERISRNISDLRQKLGL